MASEGLAKSAAKANITDEPEEKAVVSEEGSGNSTVPTHESPNKEEIKHIVGTLDSYNKMMRAGKINIELVNEIDIVGVMDSFNHLLPQENINQDIEIMTSSLNACNMSKCGMCRRTYRDRSTLQNSEEVSKLYGFNVSDESHTESLIARIDDGLSDYYQKQQMNYFVEGGRNYIGKFMKFCEENGFDDDTVKNEMDSSVEECLLLDFDPKFPLDKPTHDHKTRAKLIMDILKKILAQNSTNAIQEEVDTKYITRCELMDKVHCFSQHSFHTGNILTPKEQQEILNEETEEEEGVILINRRLRKLRKLLQSKSNTDNAALLSLLKERMRGKYNQDNMLRPGWQIQYNDLKQYRWGKHILGGSASQSAEEKTDDFVSINVIQILPKYYNLKQELTQNMIALITTFQFEAELQKARMNWNTQYRKKHHAELPLQNILALMVYCNYDYLQRKFSETYRETQSASQHSNFYHLGKLLQESVLKYGTTIKNCRVKTFYHGVRESLVPPGIVGHLGKGIQIFSPLSTSSSMAVATNFTNNNDGLIMQFGGNMSRAKCFEVAWLSDYSNEKEYLFLQNEEELQVNNVIQCDNNSDYRRILSALKTMDEILSVDYYYNDDVIISRYAMLPWIIKLIDHQLSEVIPTWKAAEPLGKDGLTEYGKELVSVYFNTTTYLSINYAILKHDYEDLFNLFCLEEYEWIRTKRLRALFPNIETIEIKNVDLCSQAISDLFEDLGSEDNLWRSNVIDIVIKTNKSSRYSKAAAKQRYMRELKRVTNLGVDVMLLIY
eukprot:734388_1